VNSVSASRDSVEPDAPTPSVIFVCVHNAGRSQMAAGLLRAAAGGRVEVRSAGTAPGERVNPMAVQAMGEIGIDISDAVPSHLTTPDLAAADLCITMGCGDACPLLPDTEYRDWAVDDPSGQPIEVVRRIRDDIARQVQALVAELARDAAG
jgi:arsenate reductase